MFTGIVEECGEVVAVVPHQAGRRLLVNAERVAEGSDVGASLAVNGVCLTVVERGGQSLSFDLGPETVTRSTLGDLAPGEPINLERPLRLGTPVGGHLVLGHVDGVGTVTSVVGEGETVRLRVTLGDRSLERYLIPKGSVAVDGVSLTVATLLPGAFEVMLIPHTLAHTTFRRRPVGARVNLEMDVIGKYLFRFLQTDPQLARRGAA